MVVVEGLRCTVGRFSLHVDLQLQESEYFVLLGMSGAGKTLLLECLCGLRPIEAGAIWFQGQDVSGLEPRLRRIGYVPQDAVLFGHLSVAGNLAFGVRKRGPAHLDPEVRGVAERLGIGGLLERRIHGLSGGERQRVALGRALMTHPSVLLLDEPVSALDEWNRRSVCVVLRSVHEAIRIPVIHVSHSRTEAGLVADRVGIMHAGSILQTGTLDELESRPLNSIVASAMALENVLEGSVSLTDGQGPVFQARDLCLPIPRNLDPAGVKHCYIPAWEIEIRLDREDVPGFLRIDGVVWGVRMERERLCVSVKDPIPLEVHASRKDPAARALQAGQSVSLFVREESIRWMG